MRATQKTPYKMGKAFLSKLHGAVITKYEQATFEKLQIELAIVTIRSVIDNVKRNKNNHT